MLSYKLYTATRDLIYYAMEGILAKTFWKDCSTSDYDTNSQILNLAMLPHHYASQEKLIIYLGLQSHYKGIGWNCIMSVLNMKAHDSRCWESVKMNSYFFFLNRMLGHCQASFVGVHSLKAAVIFISEMICPNHICPVFPDATYLTCEKSHSAASPSKCLLCWLVFIASDRLVRQ